MWSIPPTESAVKALAWRPDGRGKVAMLGILCVQLRLPLSCPVLAVARADHSVKLHSVEDGCLLHAFSVRLPVSLLQWLPASNGGQR